MSGLLHEPIEGLVPINWISKKELEKRSESDQSWAKHMGFQAEWGTFCCFPDATGNLQSVLIGKDNQPNDPRAPIIFFSKLRRELPEASYQCQTDELGSFMALGWALGQYQFSNYKSQSQDNESSLFIQDLSHVDEIESTVQSIFMARNLINTPANDLPPQAIANHVRDLAEKYEAEIEVLEGDELLKRQFPSVYTVGQASKNPPVLIDLQWGSKDHPEVVLVGKGVIFDSGGLNIKGASGMALMKKDMGGAAVSIALANLIMATQLPVRLRLLVPSVENAISGNAYRPSDVIRTRKGKTVEIGNTDAEGRIILCDALAEAVDQDPDLIIDFATLTGACRVALGPDLAGFWTPNDELANALNQASQSSKDPLWRMPLWEPYTNMLKSSVADMNNIGNSPMGGSITAALFLHEFIKPFQNWIHVDMYGWYTFDRPDQPAMADATAIRAMYTMLKQRYA